MSSSRRREGFIKVLLMMLLIGCALLLQFSYNVSLFEAWKSTELLFVVKPLITGGQRLPRRVVAGDSGGGGSINKTGKREWVMLVANVNDSHIRTSSSMLPKHSAQNNTQINSTIQPCPLVSPHLLGPIKLILDAPASLDEVEDSLAKIGALPAVAGHWQPSTCLSHDRVAIIIPFRNRDTHLCLFLLNMHPFLQRQLINYSIFVVEQAGQAPFNRAMLFNVGAVEAQKLSGPYDCYVFHDVDLLPEDDRNIYNCPQQPRHMAVAVNKFKYKLSYPTCFGGACALSRKHFEQVNGFSNMFWAWGGEDDEMSKRLTDHGLQISRYPEKIARYHMHKHAQQAINANRFNLLNMAPTRYDKDGLNSLKYTRLALHQNRSFTWVLVKLSGEPENFPQLRGE